MASMVLRRIETNIPKVDDLKLPEIIKELAMTKRGIIMFVGAPAPASPPRWRR
jgi:twitching motility protein PilU